jgi:hypothetical protein
MCVKLYNFNPAHAEIGNRLLLGKEENNPIIGAGLSTLLTMQKYLGPNCGKFLVLPM